MFIYLYVYLNIYICICICKNHLLSTVVPAISATLTLHRYSIEKFPVFSLLMKNYNFPKNSIWQCAHTFPEPSFWLPHALVTAVFWWGLALLAQEHWTSSMELVASWNLAVEMVFEAYVMAGTWSQQWKLASTGKKCKMMFFRVQV
jgi:hypothetical protein